MLRELRDVMGFRVCRANRSAEQRSRHHPSPSHCIYRELPDAEQNSREWQNARQRILDAADQVGSIWFARIAIIQALQRDRGNVVRRDFRPRFRKRSWNPEELTLLNKLVG